MSLKAYLKNKQIANSDTELKVVYLLAYFGALTTLDEDGDAVDVCTDEINEHYYEDMFVDDYALESGCYHREKWVSLDTIVECLAKCDEDYF